VTPGVVNDDFRHNGPVLRKPLTFGVGRKPVWNERQSSRWRPVPDLL